MIFVGPSGCGKLTLLRLIAGVQEVSAGDVFIDGICVTEHRAGAARMVFVVFQSHALFPHLSVQDNIASGRSTDLLASADRDVVAIAHGPLRLRLALGIVEVGLDLARKHGAERPQKRCGF